MFPNPRNPRFRWIPKERSTSRTVRFRPEVTLLEDRAVPATLVPILEVSGDPAVDEGTDYVLNLGAAALPGDETIVGYTIDWGDGTTENFSGSPTGETPTHIYANEALHRFITIDLVGDASIHPDVATLEVHVRNVENFLTVSVVTTLTGDLDADGQADPGDQLTQVVTITNQGPDLADLISLKYVPGTGSDFVDTFALFRGGMWFYDANGDAAYDPGIDTWSWFGQQGDLPVSGEWTADQGHHIGVFRAGTWYLDTYGNGFYDFDINADFGQPGDLPVVGKWNGGAIDSIGIFRQGLWVLDGNGSRAYDAGDLHFAFGQPGDLPITGDWNGDGTTEIGVFNSGNWCFDFNGNGRWDPEGGDTTAHFGQAGDLPVIGDWNRDGQVEIGVFHGGSWYFDMDRSGHYTSLSDGYGWFGEPGDLPTAGNFGPVWWQRELPSGEQASVTLVTLIDADLDPGATEVVDQAFASGRDNGTQTFYHPTNAEVATPLHVDLPVPANPVVDLVATAQLRQFIPDLSIERWSVDFRNEGDLAADQVFVRVVVPEGVFRPFPHDAWNWPEESPGVFRLAVGPLAGHQGGTSPWLELSWDPLNPPTLPLELVVEISTSPTRLI